MASMGDDNPSMPRAVINCTTNECFNSIVDLVRQLFERWGCGYCGFDNMKSVDHYQWQILIDGTAIYIKWWWVSSVVKTITINHILPLVMIDERA